MQYLFIIMFIGWVCLLIWAYLTLENIRERASTAHDKLAHEVNRQCNAIKDFERKLLGKLSYLSSEVYHYDEMLDRICKDFETSLGVITTGKIKDPVEASKIASAVEDSENIEELYRFKGTQYKFEYPNVRRVFLQLRDDCKTNIKILAVGIIPDNERVADKLAREISDVISNSEKSL